MYCNKCGKEIPNNVKFCTYCGEKTEISNIPVMKNNSVKNNDYATTDITKGLLGTIAVCVLALVGIVFVITAIKYFSDNMDAFYWLEDGSQVIAVIIYWGIAATVLFDCCIVGIMNFIKKNRDGGVLISAAISLFIIGCFIGIFRLIFNDWEFEDISIMFYRIFGTYGKLAIFTMLMSAVVFVCGIFIGNAKTER